MLNKPNRRNLRRKYPFKNFLRFFILKTAHFDPEHNRRVKRNHTLHLLANCAQKKATYTPKNTIIRHLTQKCLFSVVCICVKFFWAKISSFWSQLYIISVFWSYLQGLKSTWTQLKPKVRSQWGVRTDFSVFLSSFSRWSACLLSSIPHVGWCLYCCSYCCV